MCTIVLLRRPGHAWPLILGANRDEMHDRPWQAPARHWPGRPRVVAGRDQSAGGSWLGVNDSGVVAAVSNRRGSLGRAPGKRSRGELPLAALAHVNAAAAAAALVGLDGDGWRAFNLVIADREAAFWLRHGDAGGPIEAFGIGEGVSMLTAGDLDDSTSPRIRAYLPRFRAAPAPDPGSGDWSAWEALLASREAGPDDDPEAAIALDRGDGFGTVSSSLIALPNQAGAARAPLWRFAPGSPAKVEFYNIAI